MVDSVKNYGITGVSSTVELGKAGPKIDGSSSDQIAFTDKDGNAIVIATAEGTLPSHAVTLNQLNRTGLEKLSHAVFEVAYNSGNVLLGNVASNTYIHSVTVEKTPGNWVGADGNTEITVGDDSDPDRLFSGFDVTSQVVDETDYKYPSATSINAYVTAGGASSGNAYITLLYSGVFSANPLNEIDVVAEETPSLTVEYLIVGGGGGGGGAAASSAGGGGGGGMVRTGNLTLTLGTTYWANVGNAGNGGGYDVFSNGFRGARGNSSSFAGIVALGGGAGEGSSITNGDLSNVVGQAQVLPSTAPTGGGAGARYTTGGGLGGGGAGGNGGFRSGGVDNIQFGGVGGNGIVSNLGIEANAGLMYNIFGKGGDGGDSGTFGGQQPAPAYGNGWGGEGASAPSTGVNGGAGSRGVIVIKYPDSYPAANVSGYQIKTHTANGYRYYTFTLSNATITIG